MSGILKSVYFAVLMAFISTASFGADQDTQTPAVGYYNQAFDTNLTKLPPHFMGADWQATYDALSKITTELTKKEFETSQEYHIRISPIIKSPLVGGISLESTVAFVFNVPPYEVRYNADKQILDFGGEEFSVLHPSLNNIYGSTILLPSSMQESYFLISKEEDINGGNYTGTGAF